MPIDEIKQEILEKLGNTLKEIEKTYLGNEEFEVVVEFPDGSWTWNVTGWDTT